jgi:hypothetical protein
MQVKVISSYGLWIVNRYYTYMTDNRILQAFQKYLRFVEGEIAEEELSKAHKGALEALRDAENHYESIEKDREVRARHLADERQEITEDRAWAWAQAISHADVAIEKATVYIAKAIVCLTEGGDTFDDTDAVGEAVSQATAELAYADAAEATAQSVLAGGKIPNRPRRVWERAAEVGYFTERLAQKKELLRLEQQEAIRATAAVA